MKAPRNTDDLIMSELVLTDKGFWFARLADTTKDRFAPKKRREIDDIIQTKVSIVYRVQEDSEALSFCFRLSFRPR